MDEDTEGLKTLIKQRNQRPCYARTISLEFSCTDHSKPVHTQRKRKLSKKNVRKKSNEMNDKSSGSENELDDIQSVCDLQGDCSLNFDTNEDNDKWCSSSLSSDSEYYSANESLSSESISDDSTSQIRDNLSELDFLLYTDSDNSDSDSAFCSVNSSQRVHVDRKPISQSKQRAPSKKQKRKRRLKSKVTFLNSLPFSGLENFECCISEVKNEITESAEHVSVMKSVPSLSDLCLLAAKNLGTKNTTKEVPYRIKQIFKDSGVKKNLQKFQLSSLYRHLAYCDQKSVFEEDYLNIKSLDQDKMIQAKVLIPRRNIWDVSLNYQTLNSSGQSYNGSLPPFYIPYTHCSHTRYIQKYNDWYWDAFMISRNSLSVYATTVDLMMPPVAKLPRLRKRQPSGKGQQKQQQVEEDDAIQLLRNLTLRLRVVLNERFPTTTKYYFDMVLPYVFWARGHIGYAATMFTDLAEKETRSRMKAMYLYEIGRMYSQFDDQVRAKSCFRLAADAAISKSKQSQNEERVINEINRQTLMLTANAYDQGLMTAEKALLAFDNWKAGVTSLKSDSLDCHGIWSCMDSLLCYHAWSLENGEGTSCFLKEAKTRITSLVKSFPEMYYYLSMICALEGNAQECSEAYRCFNFSGCSKVFSVGSDMMDLNPRIMKYRSPWSILIEHVRNSPPVKPLHVVWRTQLGPLIVADKSESWESDMHSKTINLRLSSEGFITGDMQMALPPLRGIYLDPYTGYLCFSHIPGDTETWIGPQTDVFSDNYQHPDKTKESNLVVPTPTELYRDDSGNVVHLMCPSMIQAMMRRSVQVKTQHMVLTWTGSDGQHARYNLLPKIQQTAYADFIKQLQNDSINYGKKIPNWIELMTKLAQHCLSKGFSMDMNVLRNYVNKHWGKTYRSKVKEPTGKKSKAKNKENDPIKSFEGSPSTVLLGQILVFNTNICIPVKYNVNSNLYLVFIDCKNRSDFLKPVIIRQDAGLLQITQQPEFPQVLKGYRLPHADVMYCEVNNGNFQVFGNYGKQVDYITRDSILTDNAITLPVIVNRNKICFLDNKSVRSICNGTQEWAAHLGEVNKLKNIHNILVLLTDTGIKFTDGRSFLPLCIFSVDGRPMSLQVSDDSMQIQGAFKYFSILHEELLTDYSEKYTRAVIALDNHLVILKLSEEEDIDCVTVLLSIALPGHAKEICFIGVNGFLVTVTQHTTSTEHYRENLYYFDMNGGLKNYLLCLGPGPRSFFPIYLPGNTELQECQPNFGRQGWHVYMRDGHDGIICVYLHP